MTKIYYNPITKEYPRYTGDMLLLAPEVDLNDDGAAAGWVLVHEREPIYDQSIQYIMEGAPECTMGVWSQTWEVINLTLEELEIRYASQVALAKSQFPSMPIPDLTGVSFL